MVRTQIQLTEDQAKALKKIAQSRHLSVAGLIRKAVDAVIKSSSVVDIEERHNRGDGDRWKVRVWKTGRF